MVTRQKERSTFAISDVEVTNKDYSGLVADNFSVSNSSFRQCKFERMEVREASFGLRRGTQFIECSFARSDLTSHALGLSRFVRCSFEDVRLNKWISTESDFVECSFSGIAFSAIFSAVGIKERRNLIQDNDFSKMELRDVAFYRGVDLTRQKLPQDPNHILIADSRVAIDQLERLIGLESKSVYNSTMQRFLDVMRADVDAGQKQLLIIPRYHYDLTNEVDRKFIDYLRQATTTVMSM